MHLLPLLLLRLWQFTSLVCFFCHHVGFAGRVFSIAIHDLLLFEILLDNLHVVQTVSFIHSFTESQSIFSDRKTNLRSQIVLDHLYLDETELIQALLPNKYDKSCRSFRDGVGPCNQRFGNRNVCHGLSSDLSFVLSSICHSRDLMLEIPPWVNAQPPSRAPGPVHDFHRYLLHLLRQPWHIHFQVVHQLHLAHPQCHVHPLKWHRPALHPFHHPSLVKLALLISTHLVVKQRLMTAAPMASIPILIGKRTRTTTTIRRSMAWLSLVAFVNRPSRKNWTLRDVILWNCQWQPCCINRQTTFGFGSWLMGVKSTWFRLGTLQLLCSRRSFWLNSATRGWT